jgi:prophage regulatory protein
MNNHMLTLAEVVEKTHFKRSTIYQMIQNNKFPKPIKLGGRKARWRIEDVNDWLEKKGINLDFDKKDYVKGYQDAISLVKKIILENTNSIGEVTANLIINLIR